MEKNKGLQHSSLFFEFFLQVKVLKLDKQVCRIKGCGSTGSPPPPPPCKPIIFKRFKLPIQIIYRRKGNLSESPDHFEYRDKIVISRFYERFGKYSKFRPFLEIRKMSNSQNIDISYIILRSV